MTYSLKQIKKYSSNKLDNKTRSIIHGDNRNVLECLSEDYKDKVHCIYIDPPYNNGELYSHYDDKKHELWLCEIEETLKKLKGFLKKEGSIWISIDDNEMHYLKVMADKIFGRKNFINTVIWQQRKTRENRKVFSENHEYILVYAKDKASFTNYANKLPATKEIFERHKNPDNDPRGKWQSVSVNVQAGHAVKSQFYTIKAPNGKKHNPPNGRCWAFNEKKFRELVKDNRIWFGSNGEGVPRLKKFISESNIGLTPQTIWFGDEVGTNDDAKKYLLNLFPNEKVFDTPKPELLIKRIFEIATKPGDLIMDAYLGSGSSVAVAHKLGRQYIGIEIGDHIIDIVCRRLKLVISGEDGGIPSIESKKEKGFNFFKLKN